MGRLDELPMGELIKENFIAGSLFSLNSSCPLITHRTSLVSDVRQCEWPPTPAGRSNQFDHLGSRQRLARIDTFAYSIVLSADARVGDLLPGYTYQYKHRQMFCHSREINLIRKPTEFIFLVIRIFLRREFFHAIMVRWAISQTQQSSMNLICCDTVVTLQHFNLLENIRSRRSRKNKTNNKAKLNCFALGFLAAIRLIWDFRRECVICVALGYLRLFAAISTFQYRKKIVRKREF